MIRTTITPKEFEKLTWYSFEAIASDINDINVTLKNDRVVIDLLGIEEIKTLSIEDYNAILKG